jgi:hypothetical protein
VSRPPEFALGLVAIAACWVALAYKLPALIRRPHDRSVQAFCAMLFLIGLAGTVLHPPVRGYIDRSFELRNFAQLLGDCIGIASACCGLIFLAHLDAPLEQARRHSRVFGVVATVAVGALVGLFLANPTPMETDDFWFAYADVPGLVVYRMIFLGYCGYVFLNVIRLTLHYAAFSSRPSMRVGMWSVSLGGMVGMAWALLESARVLAPAGAPLPPGSVLTTIAVGLMAITVLLIAFGSTLPSWGPQRGADSAILWLRDFRSLRRLYPLWRAAWHAAPEVVLVPPRSWLVEAVDVRDVHFRLYRRLVEIRDAMLILERADGAAAPVPMSLTGRADFASEVRALEQLARNGPQL